MSEPPPSVDPDKPEDELPPLDAEAELVTDPLALALGATAPLSMALPEPVLGSDEDAPAEAVGARAPFFSDAAPHDGAPAFDAAADLEAAERDAPERAAADDDPAPAPSDPAPGESASLIVQSEPGSRRVWREIRYVALSQEKPVVVAPPPVIDDQGRLVRKYLFERSFDLVDAPPEEEPEEELPPPEPEPVEVVAEEPPPPTFSEDELAAARAAGFAEGEAAGRQAASAAAEARTAELTQQIAALVPGLAKDRDQAVSAISHEAARLAHAMVRRMMPELTRRYRIDEIEAVVVDSLNKALDQPRMIIRSPADIAGHLGDRLETVARQHGFAGRVLVLSDQSLGPSDVKVEWGDGGAERCVQRAWTELEATVQRVVAKLEQVAPVAEIPEGASEDTIGSAA